MHSLSSRKTKFNKYFYLIIFIILSFFSLQIQAFALEETHYTKQWIKNSEFNSPSDTWFKVFNGDSSDVNASIHSGQANFEILGEKNTYSLIADPPSASNWIEVDNPSFPNRPDVDEITSDGCRVSHEFDDQSAIQNPSVHWDRNITMPVNMSDYIITGASIQARVNATVDKNLDRYFDYVLGLDARIDPILPVDQYGDGDYVRFYVLLSDLEKNKVYEIAHLQTVWLGSGSAPGPHYLYDTYMTSVSQEDLIYYLSSTLSADFNKFTITLGMRLQIEDNCGAYLDRDTFTELIINFVNLTFTYEKKIDQSTSISWSQIGNSISGDQVKVENASLNFKYKIDQIWPSSLSLNSDMKILINNYTCKPSLKLSSLDTTFQDLRIEGSDLTPLIWKDVNISLSIQIFIADEFVLDRPITISIDDVSLEISCTILAESQPSNNKFLLIALISSIIIIGILLALSLRSYILVPRKLKRETALMARTQRFKDVENIQGILLIHNVSGLPLFSKNYSDLMEDKNTLFSGFIQAVSIVSEEISRKKPMKSKKFQSDLIDGIHKVIELDFKHFFCLISDIEELRTVLILNSKASKRLKQQLLNFGLSVYARFSDVLKDWNNELDQFQNEIPGFLKNYFNLDYKDFFKLAIEKSDLEKVKRKFKLTRTEFKTLIDILSISEENQIFKLISLLKKLNYTNEDLIIDTIEVLIKKYLLVPADSMYFQF